MAAKQLGSSEMGDRNADSVPFVLSKSFKHILSLRSNNSLPEILDRKIIKDIVFLNSVVFPLFSEKINLGKNWII